MKKFLKVFLAGLLSVSVCACQDKKEEVVDDNSCTYELYLDYNDDYFSNEIMNYKLEYDKDIVTKIIYTYETDFTDTKFTKEDIEEEYNNVMTDKLESLKSAHGDENGNNWERSGYVYYSELTDKGYKIVETYTITEMDFDKFYVYYDDNENEKHLFIGREVDLLKSLNEDNSVSRKKMCDFFENYEYEIYQITDGSTTIAKFEKIA